MAGDDTDIAAMLDRWRDQGADRVDPLGFHRITAMHRRALERDGDARRVLDARLAALVDAYARDVAQVSTGPAPPRRADLDPSATSPRGGSRPVRPDSPRDAGTPDSLRGTLGALVNAMAARTCVDATHAVAPPTYPELPAVEEFRQLWSTLRTGRQVRRSLAQAPTDAGPLNSAALAHRSLTLMGGLSPEYLQRFLSYVDTLSWLETLQDAGVLTGKASAQPVGAKPRARARARKRN